MAHSPPEDRRSRVPCRFFAQGRCRSGPSCPYSHATRGQKETRVEPASQGPGPPSHSTLDTQSFPVPCRFFLRGACLKGDICPFAHAEDPANPSTEAEAGAQVDTSTADEQDSKPDIRHRDIGGALVTFEDGAVVAKVSFASDFTAVRVTRLPRDTNAASVVDLLSKLGFDVVADCVRIPPSVDDAHCCADVRVEDTRFARGLCAAMKIHGSYEAVPINATIPQSTNAHRVDAKKVHCSWHKPTKTAWLSFGTGAMATTVASQFSIGIYKVLGQRVDCRSPTCGDGARDPLAWTVRLSDIPRSAGIWHVTQDIPPAQRPSHVELSPLSYNSDLPLANTLVESLLLQVGPLERWEGGSDTPGKRFKAKARFTNEADARQAVKLLNNKQLPFNQNGKLTAQLVHSARLKVSALIFDAVEHNISAHEQPWRGQHLLYTAYPPSHGFRILRIEGEASSDVATAKATLEKILSGQVLAVNGEAIWTDSFAGNGRVYQKIKEIERDLGIVIVRDKRKCQLRVLGAPSRHDEARRALTELVKQDSSSVFVIDLDAEKLAWAFRGGYRAVAAAIGSEKVTLDIVSNPRRVLVTGSEASFHIAREILSGGEVVSQTEPEAGLSTDCAICWTEAERPVRTACMHIYCSGCFEDLCLAGTSSNGPVPSVQCQGNSGRCGHRLPLTELQEHLSSAALEDVLEASFASHVARHPDDLRYCPTPDCGQVYRAAKPSTPDSGRLFMCTVCLGATCTTCHASHDGLTCAEHRDIGSGGYLALQEAKQKLGIKDCPKCGTMIEKSSGCNHMTCSVCKAHICWVCMKTFSVGRIYDHMVKDHGGIGLSDFLDMQ